jgi:hypothetical protein
VWHGGRVDCSPFQRWRVQHYDLRQARGPREQGPEAPPFGYRMEARLRGEGALAAVSQPRRRMCGALRLASAFSSPPCFGPLTRRVCPPRQQTSSGSAPRPSPSQRRAFKPTRSPLPVSPASIHTMLCSGLSVRDFSDTLHRLRQTRSILFASPTHHVTSRSQRRSSRPAAARAG